MTAWQRSYGRAGPWFAAPALALLAIFTLWPLLRASQLSVQSSDLLHPSAGSWVGLGNYSDLLGDARFRRAFANTALFALLVVPLQCALAFLLALWVSRPGWGHRWLQLVFFLPTIVAMPVLAVVWSAVYQPAVGGQMGLLNAVLSGLGVASHAWLSEPTLALPAIGFMSIWQGVGLQMMVFVAGLSAMPREPLDAARVDGANAWQRVRYVILPALKSSWTFVVTVTTILSFRLFVQPYLMTRGGPGDSTLSLVQSIYEMTFVAQDLGRGCAASILLLAWVGLITLLLRGLAREESE